MYWDVGDGHWVRENIDIGKYILLEDGSLWEVLSLDTLDSGLWMMLDSIVVVQSETGLYPYRLINTDDKRAVEAKLIGKR